MMFLQRIQTVVVSMTMIGVWSNFFINYHSKDHLCKRYYNKNDGDKINHKIEKKYVIK